MELNEPLFSKALGNRIKTLRMNSGITIEMMSKMVMVSIETLNFIEAGKHSIQLEEFIRVAKALNVNASDLIDDII